MATPKKTNRLSVGRSSKPAAEQAVPRRSAMPWPSKNTAARRKPAAKKPATPKKPGAKKPAEKRNALSDHGAKRILEELRAIRETLARHEEVLARITARLSTQEPPSRDRGTPEARTSDSDIAQDAQAKESGELP